ncbi:MAG: bacillithiol biosynthesis protein BshC, partial [Candidatus Hydrogenedens sp.]
IDNHSLLFEHFNKTTSLLKETGYKPQVHKLPDNAFFFLEENNYRSRLKFHDGVFYSEISKRKYAVSEIKRILHYEPERFSPNLLLRCIYQQMIFPVVVYVGGPAEVAYWAQLKDLFLFFNLPMPIVYPRKRLILLPSKIKKWLSELNINVYNLPQIYNNIKDNKSFVISDSLNSEIEKTKIKFIDNAMSFFDNLITIFNDKSLDNYRKTYLSKMEFEAQRLIDNFTKLQRNKNEIFQKHLTHILNTIYPNSLEQERFFSPFSFIPEYSHDFIKMIMNKTDVIDFDIGIVEI